MRSETCPDSGSPHKNRVASHCRTSIGSRAKVRCDPSPGVTAGIDVASVMSSPSRDVPGPSGISMSLSPYEASASEANGRELENCPNILAEAGSGSPVGALDDVDHMAGLFCCDRCRSPIADRVDELHDVLEYVRFWDAAMRAHNVREHPHLRLPVPCGCVYGQV